MVTRYQNRPEKTDDALGHEVWRSTPETGEALEDLVRRGAQEMLRRALEEEVAAFPATAISWVGLV